jgi:hypothetical protein
MSKHESWRTRHYWQSIGGLLIEEFLVVPRSSKEGIARRLIDGVIVLDEEPACQVGGEFEIRGRDVICVQTKPNRIGMSLTGQAYFSRLLLEKLEPNSIKTVAICGVNDPVMAQLCRAHEIDVIVISESDRQDT